MCQCVSVYVRVCVGACSHGSSVSQSVSQSVIQSFSQSVSHHVRVWCVCGSVRVSAVLTPLLDDACVLCVRVPDVSRFSV